MVCLGRPSLNTLSHISPSKIVLSLALVYLICISFSLSCTLNIIEGEDDGSSAVAIATYASASLIPS